MKYVIIGAGIAGITAAQTIRQHDPDSEIIVLGNEQFFPYRRYLLTEFMCNSIEQQQLQYTSSQFFEQNAIKFRKSDYVKNINPSNKTVKLFHNEIMSYDRLLISTGGSPALGPVLKPFKKFLQSYYSLSDILLLKQKMVHIKHCIIFGKGLSTLDLICGLRNLGKKVTYIIDKKKIHFRILEDQFNDELHTFIQEKGVELITDDKIIKVEQLNQKYKVTTLNQKQLTADIVFAWDYYKPNIECIEGTDIEKKFGILVDQQLRTTVKDIYAAGDCVEIYHPAIKDYWINFGWNNATFQGEIAGKNMAGKHEQYQIKDTIIFNLMGKPLKARWWE